MPSESLHVEVEGQKYSTDSWYNVPPNILAATSRKLHIQKDHPVSITRQIIEQNFPAHTFKAYNNFHPVVSTHENFDSLGFPPDHPGRARSDTYYINEKTLLRTHTSAHEAYLFQNRETDGYLIAADVYRRDEVDRTHYPVFHQMEGARVWDRDTVPDGDVVAAVYRDLEGLRKHDMKVEDPNPPFHAERNPLQAEHHSPAEAEAIGNHLKRSLELLVVDVFTRAKKAAMTADPDFVDEPLQVRWIEAYFPFTSPSWELEVYYGGDWLELLGCGVTKQELYINAHRPSQLGWAFGIGLDRLAMLLFQIPDIRLFWSKDKRFLTQFAGVSDNLDMMKRFAPYSKYPASPKDVSFWLRSSSAAGGGVKASTADFHENDLMEIVRSIAGDTVEDVSLIDEFKHPKTGRASMCYRINYRSLERTLTHAETNRMHGEIEQALVDKLGVEIR
jgi:phenylalanyl-tRNA synthetase alpha chain